METGERGRIEGFGVGIKGKSSFRAKCVGNFPYTTKTLKNERKNSQTQTEGDSNSIQKKEPGAKQVKANQTKNGKAPTSFS